MIARLQQRLRRTPGVARLVSVAGLLVIAAAADLGVRGANAGWIALLAVGVGAAVLGTSGVLWPLPAIWLVACLLSAARSGVGSTAFLVVALTVGAAALAAAIWLDLSPRARLRRQGRRDR